MVNIFLSHNRGFSWIHQEGTPYTKGYVFDIDANSHYFEKQELLNYFGDGIEDPLAFKEKLRGTDGFFAVVHETGHYVFAAVDRLRSIPLYYGTGQGNFYLSDDAQWLRQQVGDTDTDELSRDEYLLTGYVTGKDTLFPNVKQLQAGEFLVYHDQKLTTEQYFEFRRCDFSGQSPEELIRQLDQVHERVFQRLTESLNGRTAVIPLSGGYDSRLIAVMLKRLGYENVICFSYGRQGNWESDISAKVAGHLGYQWHGVTYNLKKWRDWYCSENRKQFYRFSQYHSSVPYIQDLPAVMSLQARHVIPDDAVIVPGHSGDFLAGTHISYEMTDGRTLSAEELIEGIYKYHYSLRRVRLADKHQKFDAKMAHLRHLDITTPEQMSVAADLWDWQERQAKFVVNSVRAFEFGNLEWRLPLWDKEMMDFWCKIPFDYRLGRTLYMQYANKYQGDMNRALNLTRRGIEEGLLKKPADDMLSVLMRKISYYPRHMHLYFTGKLQMTKIIPLPQYISGLIRGAANPKAILIESLLQRIAQDK